VGRPPFASPPPRPSFFARAPPAARPFRRRALQQLPEGLPLVGGHVVLYCSNDLTPHYAKMMLLVSKHVVYRRIT
jgi:hypothetical protein